MIIKEICIKYFGNHTLIEKSSITEDIQERVKELVLQINHDYGKTDQPSWSVSCVVHPKSWTVALNKVLCSREGVQHASKTKFSAEFKAKVVLEIISGSKSAAEM